MIRLPAMTGSLSGYFKIEAWSEARGRRVLADWFRNIITDNGLDLIGTAGGHLGSCLVGTGTATPTITDTTITSPKVTSTSVSTTYGAQASAPYYGFTRKTYRFNPQGSAYNVTEVGTGRVTNPSPLAYTLFCRQLILDGGGTPTSISVLADEYLDVTYELRNYPPLDDVEFTLEITGDTPFVTHDCVLRAARVTNATYWGFLENQAGVNILASGYMTDGAIGTTIVDQPTGNQYISSTTTNLAYGSGNLYRDVQEIWDISNGNAAGGLDALIFHHHNGAYQVSFDPPIDKTATKKLTLVHRVAWARRTLP